MSNLSNAIEQFHIFSKTPVSSSLGLGQAVNRGGHTVSLSDVLGDDLPFFSKDQFISMADAKDALNGVARENDIIQVGNEIVKRVNGSWTPITLNDGDTLQNKDGSDVLLYHKGVRLEAVTAGNNSGTSSQGDSKGGKECYFAGRIRKAGENGELVQFFIGVNDKILAGLPSLGYKPTLEVESETTTEIIQAEGTDYWINPYAGIVVFEAARPISSASVHKNDELCIKISCFEYIGKMADETKQNAFKFVKETDTELEKRLELGGNNASILIEGPIRFNDAGQIMSNREMIRFGGHINPYLELQALNNGGYAGTIAINTDTIFINGPLHLAYDANTTFNGDWLYKYGTDLYWGASKITNQSGTVYTEGSGISLFNNQISIKRSGGDNSGLSFDLQGGIKVDFSYAEKYFSWITTGPSSMNISSPSLTLGQFDSTSCIKISDNTISFNGPRIILGSDSTSVLIDGPISVSNGITIDSYEEHKYANTLYNKLGDLYWNGGKLSTDSHYFTHEDTEILWLGDGIHDSSEDTIITGKRSIAILGPNESQIRIAHDGISIKTNKYDNKASIFIQGPGDSSIVIHPDGIILSNTAVIIGPSITGINNQLVQFGFDDLATSVTFNGPVSINDNIHFTTLTTKPQYSDQSLYNVNGDLYWSDTKLNEKGSTLNYISEEPGELILGQGQRGSANYIAIQSSDRFDIIMPEGSILSADPDELYLTHPESIIFNTQKLDLSAQSLLISGPQNQISLVKDFTKIKDNNSIDLESKQIRFNGSLLVLGPAKNVSLTASVIIDGPVNLIHSLTLDSSIPTSTHYNLYNNNGDLYWNGNKLNNQGGSDYLFYSPLFKGPSNEITLELADDSNLNVDETGRLKVNSSAFASIENFNSLENRVSTLESDLIGVAVKFNNQNNDSNNVLQGALFNIQENGSIISINSEADLSDILLQSNAVIEVHVKSEQTPFNITWNEAWKWSGTPLETTEENTYYIIQIRHDAWNNIVCKVTHQYN